MDARGATLEAERNRRTGDFTHRHFWSRFIILWICVLIAFDFTVTFGVGLGMLDFSEHGIFINLVMALSSLLVVALVAIAVRYLYKDS